MNDPRLFRQLFLFPAELPDWKTLPQETQQAISDVLSEMLLQQLQRSKCDTNKQTKISEEKHVS